MKLLNFSISLLFFMLNLLSLELAHVQVVIETFLLQQSLMGAALDDLTVADDQHLVGIADGGEAMSDHKAGTSFHQAKQGFLQVPLSACVHVAGGFVEDQD